MKKESDISDDWEQQFQPDSSMKSDNWQNLQFLQCFLHNLIVVDMHIKTFYHETLCVGRGCLPVHYWLQLTRGVWQIPPSDSIHQTDTQAIILLPIHFKVVKHENCILFEQKCGQAQTIIHQNAVLQKNRAKLLGLQYHGNIVFKERNTVAILFLRNEVPSRYFIQIMEYCRGIVFKEWSTIAVLSTVATRSRWSMK